MGDQLAADFPQAHQPHVEHHRFVFTNQMLPIQIHRAILAVPGHEAHRLGVITVCQWNTGVGSTTTGGGNARHHLEVDALSHDQVNFFATPAEDERVPALQTAYFLALFSVMNQQFIDVVLGQRVFIAGLAHVHQLRIPAGKIHDALAHQAVVQDHVGFLQQAQRPERQQVRVTGARPHQVNFTPTQAGRIGGFDSSGQHGLRFAVLASQHLLHHRAIQGLLPEKTPRADIVELFFQRLPETGHQIRQAPPASRQRGLQLGSQFPGQYRRGAGGADTDQHRRTIHDGRKDEIAQRRIVDYIDGQTALLRLAGNVGIGTAIVRGANDQRGPIQIRARKHTINTGAASLRHNGAQFIAHLRGNHTHYRTRTVQKAPFTQRHFAAASQQSHFALQTPTDR